MICSWPENPSEKKEKWFTIFFFFFFFFFRKPFFKTRVRLLSLCSLSTLFLCSLGPIHLVEVAFLLCGRALHGVGFARTDRSGTVSRLCDRRRPRSEPNEAGKIVSKVREDPDTKGFKPSRRLSLLVDLWWSVVGCRVGFGVGCGG